MNSGFIIRNLQTKFIHNSYNISEAFVYGEESDFLTINRDGYAHELEVKISRGDFRADFKKSKHSMIPRVLNKETLYTVKGSEQYATCDLGLRELGNGNIIYRPHKKQPNWQTSLWFAKVTNNGLPNKFSFCVPEGLIQKNEVPDYSGLYWIDKKGNFKEIKRAKFIHKDKFKRHAILASKYYYRGLDNQRTIFYLQQEVKRCKNELDKFNGQLKL